MKKIVVKHKPEYGKEIHFVFDLDKAKKIGFDNALQSLASLSEEYSVYLDLAVKSEKSKKLGLLKVHSEYWEKLKKQGAKALEKTKKTKLENEKFLKALEKDPKKLENIEDEIKKNRDKKVEKLMEDLMNVDICFEELDLVVEETDKNKQIFDNKGLAGNIKNMNKTLDDLENALANPEKSMERRSPIFCATCVLILLVAVIVATAIVVIIASAT